MMPDPIARARRSYQRSKDVPVEHRKRITEIEKCLRGKVSDSDTGRLRCVFALNHYAWLPDGAWRMDTFLDAEATWMDLSERERLKSDALADMQTYKATEAGEIVGLTWEFRCAQDIRTMAAIDTPPANVVDAQKRQRYAASKKAGRALKREPISASKQRALDSRRRRLAAIHDALSGSAMTVADLCCVLRRPRNGPFNMVSKQGLPCVVRRVINEDETLRTEIRAVEGRPDLREMWVMPTASATEKEDKTVATRSAAVPAVPTSITLAEYQAHFDGRLAEFTPDTASEELVAWFNGPIERALVAAAGAERSHFLALANARRKELLAKRKESADG